MLKVCLTLFGVLSLFNGCSSMFGGEAVPTVPRHLVAEALSANEILVTWQAPLQGIVDSYELSITNKNTSDKIRISISPPMERYTITDLIPETTYDIKVAASSRHGNSPNSPKVSATTAPYGEGRSTAPQFPSTPTNLQLVYRDAPPSVMVRWDPAVSTHGTISSYNIRWGSNGHQYNMATVAPSMTSYIITGVEFDTTYIVSVSASNPNGRGDTVATRITTPTEFADAPQHFTAKTLSPSSVYLSWGPPLSIPQQDVLSYEVVYSAEGDNSWSSYRTRSTNIVIQSLTPGTTYTFKVQAKTAVRAGPYVTVVQST